MNNMFSLTSAPYGDGHQVPKPSVIPQLKSQCQALFWDRGPALDTVQLWNVLHMASVLPWENENKAFLWAVTRCFHWGLGWQNWNLQACVALTGSVAQPLPQQPRLSHSCRQCGYIGRGYERNRDKSTTLLSRDNLDSCFQWPRFFKR